MSGHRPEVTVGVITHPRRSAAFAKLLDHLAVALERYPGPTRLLVGNNGGAAEHSRVEAAVASSAVAAITSYRVVDSPDNNIATGRNTVLDAATTRWLAFIDDDEYPRSDWLERLVDARHRLDSPIVAGPILPVYPDDTPAWIRGIDLHNAKGLRTGDTVPFAATGNVLLDTQSLDTLRFDPALGRSGGSDTDYFLRAGAAGFGIRWVADAIVDEDIPADKATPRYTIRRCLSQGANHRRIVSSHGESRAPYLISLRAAVIAAGSLPVGVALALVGNAHAGNWLKRGFSNLGKLRAPAQPLYP